MKSHKKRLKPHTGTAVNRRDAVYKYYPVDSAKSVAVPAARCKQCHKITTDYCVSCHVALCGKHDITNRCAKCRINKIKMDYII